jgi:NhaA family Na+:H+ antiporter
LQALPIEGVRLEILESTRDLKRVDEPGSREKMVKHLREFLRLEAAGGLVLMAATVVALAVANSPLGPSYREFLYVPLEVRFGAAGIEKPLILWINDGLMAVFFFLVGLELKREVLDGHLSSVRQALLPGFAAVGGMAAPALVFSAFNWGDPIAMKGWAIPAATDIAFALGILSLLGPRVPAALKAFLLSVAIFDDLGAIMIIALFYTSELSLTALMVAAALVVGLLVLNRKGVRRPAAYLLLGIPLWVAVLKSGVHATLAGVVAAMFIPLQPKEGSIEENEEGSLLLRLEHALHPWVAFGVLPVFALANAGVQLGNMSVENLLHPVAMGVTAGLLVGKYVGVLVMAGVAVLLKVAELPEGVNWKQIQGVSLLCGVGFTMSLFIASLAFEQGGGAYLGLERVGILAGSFLSGLSGYTLLRLSAPAKAA